MDSPVDVQLPADNVLMLRYLKPPEQSAGRFRSQKTDWFSRKYNREFHCHPKGSRSASASQFRGPAYRCAHFPREESCAEEARAMHTLNQRDTHVLCDDAEVGMPK